jgi:hypothetical protein
MHEKKPERRGAQERSRCQIGHYPGKPSSFCAQPAQENVDGLVLCEKHAMEAKLEGQIESWRGLLSHIDLWSREASRRDRPDIVRLLEVQRAEATSAMERSHSDLVRSETSGEEVSSGSGALLRRGFLPLPPRGARLRSRGLRRR